MSICLIRNLIIKYKNAKLKKQSQQLQPHYEHSQIEPFFSEIAEDINSISIEDLSVPNKIIIKYKDLPTTFYENIKMTEQPLLENRRIRHDSIGSIGSFYNIPLENELDARLTAEAKRLNNEETARILQVQNNATARLRAKAIVNEDERQEAMRLEAERQEAVRRETERQEAEAARQEAEAAREKEEKEKAIRLEAEKIEAKKQKTKQIEDQIYYIKRDLEQKQDELMSLRTDLAITTTNLTDSIKKNLKEESKIKTTEITDINAGIKKTEKEIADLKETLGKLTNTGNNSTLGGFRKRSKKYNNKNNNKNNKKNNKTKTYKIKYINKNKKTNRKYKGKTSKK